MTFNNGYAYREQVVRGDRTVLEHLVQTQAHSASHTWLARILAGEVEVDGRATHPHALLRPGQLLVWNRPPWAEPEVDGAFVLVHEDAHLVAVNKPRGLPTLPGGGYFQNTLLTLVQKAFPEASPMHRLGRETSGLVLFSRTREAKALLSAAWRDHEVEKRYRALGQGVALEDTLVIAAPIGLVPYAPLGDLHAASATGKPSCSTALVLERREDSTLFQVDIATGRPHQIRIHLAFAGHPLVGDPLYGEGGVPLRGGMAVPGDGGYFLHAERLRFRHPLSGEAMELTAPVPGELRMAGE